MRKLIAAVVVVAALAFAAPKAQAGGYSSFDMGISTAGNSALVLNGPGTFVGIVISTSLNADDYVVCWDSNTATINEGFVLTTDLTTAGAKRVGTCLATAAKTQYACPPVPDYKTPVTYGIVCKKSGIGIRARIFYIDGN